MKDKIKKKDLLRFAFFLFGLALFFYGVYGIKDRFPKKSEPVIEQTQD